MKILFASVIYEGVHKYLDEFIECIENQSFKQFDTLIINDGLNDMEHLNKVKSQLYNCTILEYSNCNLNPAQLRVEMIKYSINNNYDLLIFGDSDDLFSNDRIKKIKDSFSNKVDFYYNDLIVKDTDTDFFLGKLPDNLNNSNALDDYNFVGMSNSAVNINKIKKVVDKLDNLEDCVAFDWYFYTLLLKLGLIGIKVNNTKTYYRIYDNNIAGYTNELTNLKLRNGIKVKKFQYKTLSKFEPLFLERYRKINKLENILESSEEVRLSYIKYINKKYNNSVFWWENIKLLDEFLEGNNEIKF